MKTYIIKQSINIILMIFVFLALYGNLRSKNLESAIVNTFMLNALFTIAMVEKKP